jgi:hypothetical protein
MFAKVLFISEIERPALLVTLPSTFFGYGPFEPYSYATLHLTKS